LKIRTRASIGFAVAMTVILATSAFAQSGMLNVLNVHVARRPSSQIVDVTYDLQTADGLAATVSLYLSTDNGATYPVLCQAVTGDVGAGIMPGAARQIVWDAGTEFPFLSSNACRLRVTADDGIIQDNNRTVVFTTQDPAHIIYPSGASHLDSVRVQDLIAAIASADTVYRLGTGFDVPSFAYSEIDHRNPEGFKDPSGVSTSLNCDGGEIRANVRYLVLRFPQFARRSELVYIPWQDYLPPNCSILSATMNVSLISNVYYAIPDTIIAVQMSNATDGEWYKTKGVGANYPDFAHAAWNRQQSTNNGAWSGSNDHPWQPALDDRRDLWAWGEVSDWSGSTAPNIAVPIPRQTNLPIKLTNCVQSAVSGGVNNGIILCYADASNGIAGLPHYAWDDYSSAAGRTPYVVVKYRLSPYVKPFDTSDWAFVATTDDGIYAANNAYTNTFLAHGGKYTVFMAKMQVGLPYGQSTARQLVGFHTRGMEVGNHSRYHMLDGGLTHWSRSMTMADTNSAAWDSLMFDVNPSWMYNMADSIVGDLRGDPTFGKSFALPTNSYSPEALLALEKTGYTAVRTAAMTLSYSRDGYYVTANQRPGKTDSLMTGAPTQMAHRPRNMTGLPTFISLPQIASWKANPALTPASLDSLKTNIHKVIFQIRGQDRRALCLYWHDFKTNPSTNGYGEGLNADELDAMLQVVDATGGRYMTASEYTNWIKARATAVATPASYAQPDTFKVQASDRVWFIPDE
jgi:hypothetical protein